MRQRLDTIETQLAAIAAALGVESVAAAGEALPDSANSGAEAAACIQRPARGEYTELRAPR
ncbi:MAG: hypothetical protein ACNA7W_18685 [Pseudomonadales bacterium]